LAPGISKTMAQSVRALPPPRTVAADAVSADAANAADTAKLNRTRLWRISPLDVSDQAVLVRQPGTFDVASPTTTPVNPSRDYEGRPISVKVVLGDSVVQACTNIER